MRSSTFWGRRGAHGTIALYQLVIVATVAVLAACAVDRESLGPDDSPRIEDCTTAGDEDGNGLADCADPVCASKAFCLPTCGNAVKDPGEQCDDGNVTDGDGCEHDCTSPSCGNAITDPGEQCDDGNVADADGCEHDCTLPACGNAITDPGEQCDDGNVADADGCEHDCTLPACGNAITDPGEQCDDGNIVDGDGCEHDCTLDSLSVAITSPGPGTTVHPRDLISVAVELGSGFPPDTIVLIFGAGIIEELVAPPYVANITIPEQSIGSITLRADAVFSDSGRTRTKRSTPINLKVELGATLQSIEVVNGSQFLQRPGSTLQLLVGGRYSDGVLRNITRAPGIRYAVNTHVVSVSSTGEVTALKSGFDAIAIGMDNLITSISVEVGEPRCGDFVVDVDRGEECDDGNQRPGDGCDGSCHNEPTAAVAVCKPELTALGLPLHP